MVVLERGVLEGIIRFALLVLRKRIGWAELEKVEVKKSKIYIIIRLSRGPRVKLIYYPGRRDIRVYSGMKGLDLSLKRSLQRELRRVGGVGEEPS
ncbi:hypothetical protein ACSU1N_07055 [Thermogladius sp. 4427co]|uniref:hypothetical protein n=1 Tax=Thermogladius sp. 4427co TaxID=3450718 RepID=UPI003F7AF75B